jgi:hypothetical protein
MWLSADPAMGEYIPGAPVNDEARKRNGNLPGMGGVFNYVNLHVYHYAGNNPVVMKDPDGNFPPARIWDMPEGGGSSITKKSDITVVVQRTGTDNGNNGMWYQSTMKVMVDGIEFFSASVQSTADYPTLNQPSGPNGSTLPPGEYKGTLRKASPSYENAIEIIGDYLIHPDQYTTTGKIAAVEADGKSAGPWNQPYSAGCQILKKKDFDRLITTLHSLGYQEGDNLNIKIMNPDNWEYL